MKDTYLTIRVMADELGIAYQTAYRWVATVKAVPSEFFGSVLAVRRSDFEKFAADYRAGKYERWAR